MRGKRRIFGLAALLSLLLAVPLVFSLGIIEFPDFSVESSSSASVFVDPAKNITDYEDAIHNVTIGSTVTFHINISAVTDLFTWQINMSWDPAILNFSGITYGPFLRGTDSPNGTSSWINKTVYGDDIIKVNYPLGFAAVAETILGDYSGVNDGGRLVSIEFHIVGYGCTDLTISTSGTLQTTLLDSVGVTITYDTTDGYFRNKLIGDADGDGKVNVFDIVKVKHHWYPGPPVGAGGYERNVDIDDDGKINVFDIILVKNNWNRGPVP